MGRIFLSPPDVGPDERRMLIDAFDSGWVAPVGPDLAQFEIEFARAVGVPNSVALSSGTAGLHLALVCAGVQAGDEVIVSSFTFAASAFPVKYLGAEPVFIDSAESSWNLDPELLADELSLRARTNTLPRAVLAVDLYGHCADYREIVGLCEHYAVPLIEDATEALGAMFEHRMAGSFGRCAVFSFNGNKPITTGGGGMVVSHDPDLVDRVHYLATQARHRLL
jgi:dTDP-4-amino-4,6-dideoxygalactose transaminase